MPTDLVATVAVSKTTRGLIKAIAAKRKMTQSAYISMLVNEDIRREEYWKNDHEKDTS